MQELQRERCLEYAEHILALCNVPVSVLDTQKKEFLDTGRPNQCKDCTYSKCTGVNTHLYGSNEAYRWNGQYIYYCPLGLVYAAAPVVDESGRMEASLIAGPMIVGDPQDTLFDLPEPSMAEAVSDLPVVTTSYARHLAAILSASAAYAAGIPNPRAIGFVYEQDKILNSIYTVREQLINQGGENVYPIEYEKRLHSLICSHDKAGAQQLLNELIGHIYCASNFDLPTIKVRALELVVILSRATIDAGADVQEIFLFNSNYISEIEKFDSLDDLSVWLSGIMHRFINYSFDFTQVKHSDIVYKVMEYVKSNYSKKISLDDVAKHVYLSRSYLSSVFKNETGYSLFNYINRVRVEKSKLYLLDNSISLVDVAALCGFEDQSYFTKVFKKATGVSPKKYRDSRGNIVAAQMARKAR
ncbi:MAG: AraC family transcriptional regulator [Clostridiales bacterium]|nr:AraC family transcriptional regulator [Clostridiales bacterium]